jgi:predicted ABC-type exoprotein transport system permease subunit
VLGGVHKWFKVFANNHRTNLGLNKEDAVEVYYNAVALFADSAHERRGNQERRNLSHLLSSSSRSSGICFSSRRARGLLPGGGNRPRASVW